MKKSLLLVLTLWTSFCFGQAYDDYIGAGHDLGIMVTASSSEGASTPEKTIDGSGMDDELFAASRFIAQATFGAKLDYIKDVKDQGFEAWIDDQFEIEPSYMLPTMNDIWLENKIAIANAGEDTVDIFGPWAVHFHYAWWQNNMTNEDLLRQRVAQALSEIVVTSINSDLRDWGDALSSYYDLLIKNSFGSYKTLLKDVTLHPAMGYYLSHFNNPKAVEEENIRPDENYAREIMQLFTIGLYELNMDGTRKLNGSDPIPTYDNDDIREMAKVFTGLGPSKMESFVWWADEPYFGLDMYSTVKTAPLKMYEDYHETKEKILLKNTTLPANQNGMKDINDAIDFLFNHPNTAPFVSHKLIQRLVKSNPTPQYVERIATVFKNSEGDLKQVVKAILLDTEARDGHYMYTNSSGMLRAPLLRYAQFARSMDLISPRGHYWNNGFNYLDEVGHHPMGSPTVFNFYLPNFQPVGPIADANLDAPEYKIHNTSTAINYINIVHAWTTWDYVMYSWMGDYGEPEVNLDTRWLEGMADDPEKMINELDKIFTHGQLTDEFRDDLRQTMKDLTWDWNEDWIYHRARMLLYLFMISPDYNILK